MCALQHDDSIIYMRPKVDGYGLLDYDKSDEIVQLGVDVARQRIRVRVLRAALRCTTPSVARSHR